MNSGQDKIIVKTEGLSVKNENQDGNTEEWKYYALVDRVKSEYNEYDGQYSISEDINIKLEPNLSDDASQAIIQRKQTASGLTVAEHVVKLQNLKHEKITFECKHCFEEFSHEQEYNAHMRLHLKTYDADSERETSQMCEPRTAVSSGWESAHNIEHKHAVQTLDIEFHPAADLIQHSVAPLPAQLAAKEDDTIEEKKQVYEIKDELHTRSTDSNNHEVKLHDTFKEHEQSKKSISSRDRQNFDTLTPATSESDVTQNINESDKLYSCEFCEYKCTAKINLVRHKRTHTGEKPFSCNICDFKCTLNGNLARHMRTHTGEKPFACNVCDFKCKLNGNLVRHMRTHSGEKPYSCELCEYKCTHKVNLMLHMRTHTGEKPYACSMCDFKCTLNGNLARHMRTHTGEKPYSCELCEYKCTHKINLVMHTRTHTGEKPFSCNVCDFKCTLKGNLVRHMRTHTGEKPYSCKVCKYACTTSNALGSHMRRTHPGL